MKALFEVVAGPLAQPHTSGVRFAGLRTVAFDGLNSLKVPDTDRNRSWMGRIRYRMGWAGYPTLRLMTLAETGTRALLGAAIGSAADRDEATLARRLLPLLRPGMLVLLDRAFDANAFLREVAGTGAMLLARSKSTRNPRVLEHLPDGSYLSCLDGLAVRIIEADLTMTGADGSRVRDRYRLITTLLDHRRYPAAALVRLYHERWEIESAYLALRHTLLNGHVLRSGDRPGLEQETWALLTLWVPETLATLCDLRVFMEEATEPVMSDDLDIGVDRIGKRSQRAGLIEESMGSMGIEMGFVLGEDHPQVRGVDDEDPVEDLAAHAAYPALHDRVRSGCLDGRLDDPNALCLEHRIESVGELSVPVTDQKRELASPVAEVEQQVAGLLGDPAGARMGGDTEHVDPAGRVLHDRKAVQPR